MKDIKLISNNDSELCNPTEIPNDSIGEIVDESTALGTSPEADPGSTGTLLDSLPFHLRDFALGQGLDPELVTLLMYSATSLIAGRNIMLSSASFSKPVVGNLYLNAFTPPAYGKTIGLQRVFEPVYEIERRLIEEARKERIKLAEQTKLLVWAKADQERRAKDAYDDARKDLAKTSAKLDDELQDLEKQSGWMGNLIVSDATPAALKLELSTSPEIYTSLILGDAREFLSLLSKESSDRQATGIRQILLNGYGGERLAIIRATGNRRFFLEDPRLAVLLLSQTDNGVRFLASPCNAESGLTSRMLSFIFNSGDGRSLRSDPESGAVWKETIEKIWMIRTTCAPHFVPMTEAASQYVNEVFSRYHAEAEKEDAGPLVRGFWSRAPEQFYRLSLVHALLKCTSEGEPKVDMESVKAAELFLTHAFQHLANGSGLVAALQQESGEAKLLRKAVLANGGKIFLRDLVKHGLTKLKVERLCVQHPEIFEIKRLQTGKKGGPRKIVRLRSEGE